MRALRYLGYGLFFVFSFLVGIYLTFPWNAVKDRLFEMVKSPTKGEPMLADLDAESLEPHWFTGAKVTNLKVTLAPGDAPIEIPTLIARAHVLSLLTGGWGGSVSLPIAQGTIDAEGDGNAEEMSIEAKIDKIELSLIPGLQGAIGLPLGGKISLDSDLKISSKEPNKTEGTIELRGQGIEILKGGKLSGFPVPELVIGDFDWKIPIQKGKAKIDKQTVKGENVELLVDGDISILSPPSKSTVNLTLSFKPTEAFLKKEPILNALLANIQSAKGSDGFYSYGVVGNIKHPRFSARRK
jgi:type II secretion system protein N